MVRPCTMKKLCLLVATLLCSKTTVAYFRSPVRVPSTGQLHQINIGLCPSKATTAVRLSSDSKESPAWISGTVHQRKRVYALRASNDFIGEDAAAFDLAEQDLKAWGSFLVAVSGVLGVLFYVWLYDNGLHWGDQFVQITEQVAGGDSTWAITYMLGFFAVAHSGLASLRPYAEPVVGARPWRYIFALVSLPLAFTCVVYFINHRYDGIQLWDLRLQPGMHDFVWWTSLVSFLFLYPSTFNLLEVAAVERPELHLWETGIARISRHPQAVGQLLWCTAHTAYIGTSFMCATSVMLCAHHFFAVWNGDRRLRDKFGDKAEIIRSQTSVVPFAAILSGKQQLPENYIKEFLRPSYATILIGSIAAYYFHPFMQAGATLTQW